MSESVSSLHRAVLILRALAEPAGDGEAGQAQVRAQPERGGPSRLLGPRRGAAAQAVDAGDAHVGDAHGAQRFGHAPAGAREELGSGGHLNLWIAALISRMAISISSSLRSSWSRLPRPKPSIWVV